MLKTFLVHHHVNNGKLEIELPDELDNTEVQGVLVLQVSERPDSRGWPPGYFKNTFGALRDVEGFERPPQGEFETREDFD
jgi:hypothetical protein